MPETMKAAVLHGLRDCRLDEVPVPRRKGEDEVLVQVRSCGVCGSDVHYYTHGRIGGFVVESPLILGHECAGVVTEAGSAVTSLQAGDRVAIEPGWPCRKCAFCKLGKYNLCPDVEFYATPPYDGAFAEYVRAPADFCFKLPDNVSTEAGAMVEPLSTGLQTAKRGGVKPGDTVFIAGSGPIGLMCLQGAKAFGATRLIISDVVASRLALAAELGATDTVNLAAANAVEAVKDLTGGRGADVTIEAAGAAQATKDCFAAVKSGGVVVLVGMAPEANVELNVLDVIIREYDVRGVFRYANVHPQAVALLAAGAVDVERMITQRFTLDQAVEAVDFAEKNKETAIKVMVNA